jgi:multisubunit Na+/H+ antiporter MnhG subunit
MFEYEAAAFAFEIRNVVWMVVGYGAALLSVIALVHCAVQKPDAFTAIGTLTKGAWLGLLAISFGLALIFGGFGGLGLFGLVALCAALVYLLDVRTGIKDMGGGAY